ncbi:hypothetical protein I308_103608 [Cryptococcus tetragattii IND107]|uniref:RED-like N-terminal domain-containing protein n=1 Tax=Cryptococcus tetragattii IND107 TaxID=1296105 RepID=A0ABR3BT86_9TREE|nr:hypothetical protein I308_05559 [Cryptococcus tetragattii IND107]
MDQDAFRSLLSAPRAGGSSSSRSVLGAPPPKRGWGLKAKEGYEKKEEPSKEKESLLPFAPRQQVKKDSKYKDRADLRRKGADDEFKSVEKLLEDFEARKANATAEELEEIEKQRAYLGGDAEHSVLVKGLDYALLAARKAELAREEADNMDEELEELGRGLKGKRNVGVKDDAAEEVNVKEEALGRGFKSIAQKKAELKVAMEEKKKKKKKKKVKVENNSTPAPVISQPTGMPKDIGTVQSVEEVHPITKLAPPPLPESDEDEDIFGGVGEYDLKAAAGPESDSDDEDEIMSVDIKEPDGEERVSRGRSRSRSFSRGRSYSRDPSLSRSHDYGKGLGPRSPGRTHSRGKRARSRSREYRYPSRSRSRSREYSGRRYSRSPSYDRYDRRRPSSPYRRRSPSPYRQRRRSPYSRSRSPVFQRGYKHRRTSYDRSPFPGRRYASQSRSRSPPRRRYPPPSPKSRFISRLSPAPARERSGTRSLSPVPYYPYPARSPSRSLSPSSDEGPVAGTRLQPLASSAIPSLKTFLAAHDAASKEAEKKARKAKWRAQQGLPAQENDEGDIKPGTGKHMNEKQKANRDYQLLMNKMNKEKQGEKSGKEA